MMSILQNTMARALGLSLVLHCALFLFDFTIPRFNPPDSGGRLYAVLSQAPAQSFPELTPAAVQQEAAPATSQTPDTSSTAVRKPKPSAVPPSPNKVTPAESPEIEQTRLPEAKPVVVEESRRLMEQTVVAAQTNATEETAVSVAIDPPPLAEARTAELLSTALKEAIRAKARASALIKREEKTRQAAERRRAYEQARIDQLQSAAKARDEADSLHVSQAQQLTEVQAAEQARVERDRAALAKSSEEATALKQSEEMQRMEERKRAEEQLRTSQLRAEAKIREAAETRRLIEAQKLAEVRAADLARAESERLAQAKAVEDAATVKRQEEARLAEERKRAEEQTRLALAQADARKKQEAEEADRRGSTLSGGALVSNALKEVRAGAYSASTLGPAEQARAREEAAIASKLQKESRENALLANSPNSAKSDQSRRGSIGGGYKPDIALVSYSTGWRNKLERIGSISLPRLSKNRAYDTLLVAVSINSDGSLVGIRVDKSSGHQDLDDAVRRVIEVSAPFTGFPPLMRRRFDVVEITHKWSFKDEMPTLDIWWD